MTKIEANVLDPLAKQVKELAEPENVTVDQLVSIALAYQVSAWRKRDTVAERAKRGNWEKFDPSSGQSAGHCSSSRRREIAWNE